MPVMALRKPEFTQLKNVFKQKDPAYCGIFFIF